jgi:hypothetical protein
MTSSKYEAQSYWTRVNIPRRYARVVIALGVGLLVYLFLFGRQIEQDWSNYPQEAWPTLDGNPPSYNQYLEYERHLPAHNPDLPYPDGNHAKYIYFESHQWGVGWGNVLQEMIYNAFFAYHVKRSFVFYNYTWSMDGSTFTRYNGRNLIPSRIPLSVFVSGPMVGGSMGPKDSDAPRAVSLDYFNEVCPPSERYNISGDKVLEVYPNSDPTASQVMNWLVDVIQDTPERCVQIPAWTRQIFNFYLFGSKNILDMWPMVRKSPIFTRFGWSPLVHAAYAKNRKLFEDHPSFPSSLYHSIVGRISKAFSSDKPNILPALSPPFPPLPGLLVLHIRRGDYEDHCMHLVNFKSQYNGYNCFDELPDHFTPPPGPPTEEVVNEYKSHCFPNIKQIVDRVSHVRKRVNGLQKLYIMTNGDKVFLHDLKLALHAADHWDQISTSRDLTVTWEQKPIAQALDMYVAQRAQAFIGNGFSSMTSNIVMFRMGTSYLRPNDTFFW